MGFFSLFHPTPWEAEERSQRTQQGDAAEFAWATGSRGGQTGVRLWSSGAKETCIPVEDVSGNGKETGKEETYSCVPTMYQDFIHTTSATLEGGYYYSSTIFLLDEEVTVTLRSCVIFLKSNSTRLKSRVHGSESHDFFFMPCYLLKKASQVA